MASLRYHDNNSNITPANTTGVVTLLKNVSDSLKPILLSHEAMELFSLINYVVLCGAISFFGIGANVINMAVFIKQGFKDSINISLLGLTVSDLACMITVFYVSIFYNPAVAEADPPFEPQSFVYLTAGWPHECFNRATSFITAFITLERCLCITTPLKVKTIITPRRTKIIIIGIFVLMIAAFSPTYFVNSLQWQLDKDTNRTIINIKFADNRAEVETISFLIHSVLMSAVSLLAVSVCTIVLVVKLNKKAKWRKSATSVAKTEANSKSETMSNKEKRVVKMVTFISLIFIICFVPATLIVFMMVYDRQFSINGYYHNIYMSVWAIAFVLETINSSVNIIIYYAMSSKFKATLMELFKRNREGQKAKAQGHPSQ